MTGSVDRKEWPPYPTGIRLTNLLDSTTFLALADLDQLEYLPRTVSPVGNPEDRYLFATQVAQQTLVPGAVDCRERFRPASHAHYI